MDESSDEDGNTKVLDYVLIEFIIRGRKSKKLIDAVPSSWVTFDKKKKKFTCPFPPEPFVNLHNLVKKKAPADKSWDIYNVIIRGHAANYKDALKKIDKLKTKENAFSTDAEADSLEKISRLERALKIEHLNKSLAEARSLILGSDTESDKSVKSHKRMNKSKKSSIHKKSTSSREFKSSNDLSKDLSSSGEEMNQSKFTDKGIQKVTKTHTGQNKSLSLKTHEPSKKSISKSYSAIKNVKQTIVSTKESHMRNAATNSLNVINKGNNNSDNQQPSTSHQIFPVTNTENLNTVPILFDSTTNWEFPIDAVVDKNGLVVIPEDTNTIENELSALLGEIQGTSVDQGVYLHRDQFLALMTQLTILKLVQKNQSKSLSKIETLLEQKHGGVITDTCAKIFGADFPLNDINSLYDVEKKLATNPELKNKFCSPMALIIDKDNSLQKNVNAVMRKYITRDLASNFTATRKMADRIVFALNVSNIYKCIIDTLSTTLLKSEPKITAAIGTAFTQSQYWDGNRTKVSKKEVLMDSRESDSEQMEDEKGDNRQKRKSNTQKKDERKKLKGD